MVHSMATYNVLPLKFKWIPKIPTGTAAYTMIYELKSIQWTDNLSSANICNVTIRTFFLAHGNDLILITWKKKKIIWALGLSWLLDCHGFPHVSSDVTCGVRLT